MSSDASAPQLPVPPADIASATRTPAGTLSVCLTGVATPIDEVRVRRCFPWSSPDGYISVLNKDGKEIALLDSWTDVSPAVREVLQAELHDTLFHPRITRLANHSSELGVLSIAAQTDRGEVTFQIRTRDDVRFVNPRQMLLRDADGNTYEIPDIQALDPDSQRALYEYS